MPLAKGKCLSSERLIPLAGGKTKDILKVCCVFFPWTCVNPHPFSNNPHLTISSLIHLWTPLSPQDGNSAAHNMLCPSTLSINHQETFNGMLMGQCYLDDSSLRLSSKVVIGFI